MPSACAVRWCTSIQSKTDNVSFHRLPVKNPQILNKWLRNMNITKYSKTSVVCSKHFKNSDYKVHTEKKNLKENAVPVSSLCKTPPKDMKVLQILCQEKVGPSSHDDRNLMRNKIKKRKLDFSEKEENCTTNEELMALINEVQVDKEQYNNIYEEHSYPYLSPKTSAQKITYLIQKLKQQCRRTKLYTQQVQRLKHQLLEKEKVISDLKDQMKKSILLPEGGFNDTLKQLIEIHREGPKPKKYPTLVRQFSVSMNFYSSHGYNFLRNYFTLPHPRTIRTWAATISGKAEFTRETLNQIKEEIIKSKYTTYATLIFDEMAIKKQVDFNGKEVIGYCDLGGEFIHTSENSTMAKEALVFYCKAVNAVWKFPIGYCLIAGLDAEIKTILVMEYIKQLQEIGVVPAALTCDGTRTNLNVLHNFGIQTNTSDHCSFTYSYAGEETESGKIRGILDPVHMLKLLRNLLTELGTIYEMMKLNL